MLGVFIHKNHYLLIRLQAVLNIIFKEKSFWYIWKRRKWRREYTDGLSAVLRLKIDYKIRQKKENRSSRSIHKYKRTFSNATPKFNNKNISKSIL